ncbi:MAG: site-2 protease family protein [Thermodesulfovibrionales bacterium]|nr:site-2 protease family protein [Thermodesulfovibrionales bacterium]MDP3111777.1 site-2 protease family protein [Thermodesulfovibrionales bacterium]
MDPSSILRQLAISALPVLIAITFHELSHGLIANKLGDPTAKMMGRLTINPIAHIDLFGTIIMPLLLLIFTNGQFVFGYAKPVPINPMNFKNPRRDMAISAAGGPATNILLAIVSMVILKFAVFPLLSFAPEGMATTVLEPIAMMLKSSIIINVVLASFNLIPIPPLDGGRVVVGFLPHRQAMSFSKIEPFGFIIVIILIYTHIADYFVMPMVNLFLQLLSLL